MAYVQVVAGLILLVFAGDFLVRGAVSIAQRAGVPTLVIGLTIVAFGTSAPELVVGVDAVLSHAPTLALGNVVGSNIANVLLVVGLPALIAPLHCGAPRLGRNIAIMLAATIVFILMCFRGVLDWPTALILLTGLVGFLLYSALRAKCNGDAVDPLEELDGLQERPDSYKFAAVLVVAGLAGLAVGADLLVTGSVEIARAFGVSEAVIGLTLVAIGTSLPELVTGLVAAVRGHCDVAVGNVVGSNIFNILCIMGVSSMVGPIPVPESFLRVDVWVMLASALLLVPFCSMRTHVGRFMGVVFLGLYVAYLVYLTHSADSAAAMGLPL
ncbi:MAG: calcium/sodium antiporter [Alphaproteobacteria bacterium]|nr:MAG: calcium/sodium antiporter [Alphaproteobacteria bacterium]